MTLAMSMKGMYIWKHDDTLSYIYLTTDDIILDTTQEQQYHHLCKALHSYFDYTTQQGMQLKFLNLRIIQSQAGISIDQTAHIEQNILRPYWKQHYGNKIIKFYSEPFPTNPKFEYTLYQEFPLTGKTLKDIVTKHDGFLAHWVGEIMHISTQHVWIYHTVRCDLSVICPALNNHVSMCYIR